ncbi:hypothetical protein BpHYR1_023230 [Brachionus plicatilis]|uniref:Uncharacterized protein n=1 Tax=Brachionus plicatilis TaxID=10195 RepID=A0A3M7ST03_BRAPC|nr:hypothetical protein BpHYR1_023230 [Brachionus plicatilis]
MFANKKNKILLCDLYTKIKLTKFSIPFILKSTPKIIIFSFLKNIIAFYVIILVSFFIQMFKFKMIGKKH